MMWSVQFYHERRGLLARYSVEAALPPAAVVLGRRALYAEYPNGAAPARPTSLYQRARADANDGGWVLYRIASVGSPHGTAEAHSRDVGEQAPPGAKPVTVSIDLLEAAPGPVASRAPLAAPQSPGSRRQGANPKAGV